MRFIKKKNSSNGHWKIQIKNQGKREKYQNSNKVHRGNPMYFNTLYRRNFTKPDKLYIK